MQFTLPQSELPQDKMLRREMLDNYFPSGLIPFEQREGMEWKIHTFTPDHASFYVDPFLHKALEIWPETVSIENIGDYWRVIDNAILSFNDSWSAYYWSCVISWLESIQCLPKKICLFHIDDHLDLESPHLTVDANHFKSIFSSREVDFRNPLSIKDAIEEKAIGIDGFITPLIHTVDSLEILHLRYAHKTSPRNHPIAPIYIEDTLLAKGEKRIALDLNATSGSHSYMISGNISDLIDKAREHELILLHIDCDAFSNRFNLDSTWNLQKVSIDLGIEKIKLYIDQLFEGLSQLNSKIFLNVALSPGFFPAEYWGDISRYIFDGAKRKAILKNDAFAGYLKTFAHKAN